MIRRTDMEDVNDWSNFTNWPYKNTLPYDIILAPTNSNTVFVYNRYVGPGSNFKKIVNSYKWLKRRMLNGRNFKIEQKN